MPCTIIFHVALLVLCFQFGQIALQLVRQGVSNEPREPSEVVAAQQSAKEFSDSSSDKESNELENKMECNSCKQATTTEASESTLNSQANEPSAESEQSGGQKDLANSLGKADEMLPDLSPDDNAKHATITTVL